MVAITKLVIVHHFQIFNNWVTGWRCPSTIIKPSTTLLFPVHIKIRVNNHPTEAIVDTGSAISVIHQNFLKTIQRNKFTHISQACQTANSTSLNIVGQIQLEILIKHIKTFVTAYVATNLITSILLDNDWINSNHVHHYGDKQYLTILDQYSQLSPISSALSLFQNSGILTENSGILEFIENKYHLSYYTVLR